MDRSFLTDEAVIEASRDFVCIRCATYEDEEEAEFLKWVFTGRNGDLENTVFCILSPDGTKKLIRGGRGPMQFRRAQDMADEMVNIAQDYSQDVDVQGFPQLKNVRLGINVAACDNLPAIIVFGQNQTQLDELKSKVSPFAWEDELMGMFVFSSTTDRQELDVIEGLGKSQAGFAIVAPDDYGQKARLITQLDSTVTVEQLRGALANAAHEFVRPDKSHNQHVRNGRRNGVEWETEIPVTDSHALRAQQGRRGR